MHFLKPYRFLVFSISILIGYYLYITKDGFPKQEELIIEEGEIVSYRKVFSSIKVKLHNDRLGVFYAKLTSDNLKDLDYETLLVKGQRIQMDVLQKDFWFADYIIEYDYDVYGFTIDGRKLSTVESYIKNKKSRHVKEFISLLILIFGIDLIARKRVYIVERLSKTVSLTSNWARPEIKHLFKSISSEFSGIAFATGLLIWASYLHLYDLGVFEFSDLRSLKIVLSDKPEYHTYKIKTTTYREINLRAYGYKKIFKIGNLTYKSVDHSRLKSMLNEGDTVSVWLAEEDIKNLKRQELVNNYNAIFGLVYKSENLIDFDDRNLYQKKENKGIKLIFFVCGLIIIAVSIIKIRRRQISQ